jgi:hypothetical protein
MLNIPNKIFYIPLAYLKHTLSFQLLLTNIFQAYDNIQYVYMMTEFLCIHPT